MDTTDSESSRHKVILKKVISPSCFIAVWAPGSKYYVPNKFLESVNNYCSVVGASPAPRFFPKKNQIVAVRHPEKRFYFRARVEWVATRCNRFDVCAFLVDIGTEIVVPLEWIVVLLDEFLVRPFGCVQIYLPLFPRSITMASDLSTTMGKTSKWDPSAVEFADRLINELSEAEIEILNEIAEGKVLAKLYLSESVGTSKLCYNDALIKRDYALEEACDPSDFLMDDEKSPTRLAPSGHTDTGSLPTPFPAQAVVAEEIHSLQRKTALKCQELDERIHIRQVDTGGTFEKANRFTEMAYDRSQSRSLSKAPTQKVNLHSETESESLLGERGGHETRRFPNLPPTRSPRNLDQYCNASSDRIRSPSMPEKALENTQGFVMNAPKKTSLNLEHSRGRWQPLRRQCPSDGALDGCRREVQPDRRHASPNRSSVNGGSNRIPPLHNDVKRAAMQSASLGRGVSLRSGSEHHQVGRVPQIGDDQQASSAQDVISYPHLKYILDAKNSKGGDLPAEGASTSAKHSVLDVKITHEKNGNDNSRPVSRSVGNVNGQQSSLVATHPQHPGSTVMLRTQTSARATQPLTYCLNMAPNNDSLDIVDQSAEVRKILVCGKVTARPIKIIKEAHFDTFVKCNLAELGIQYPSTIQSYIWPAIVKGLNISVVSGPGSGKTVGYLSPLISRIREGTMYSELPLNNEPIVLVICASYRKANKVFHIGNDLTRGSQRVKLVLLHGGSDRAKQIVNLVNGCDILVATPYALLRILNSGDQICPTGFSRLCHLIFDDADILTDTFKEQIKEILHIYAVTVKVHHRSLRDVQIMTFSNKWTAHQRDLLKTLVASPVLLCSALCESMVFAGVRTVVHTFRLHEQQQKLCDEVIGNYLACNRGKIVICVERPMDAKKLQPLMQQLCSDVIMVHHRMDMIDVMGAKNWWNNSPKSHCCILIATDDALGMMGIDDADCLVHYDIPEFSTGKFGRRFICLLKHMRSDDFLSVDMATTRSECEVHIIVTDKGYRQAYSLLYLLQRLNSPIPETLRALALGYFERKEEGKAAFPLCYRLKATGKCRNTIWCTDRHLLLPSVDAPSSILVRGSQVRFVVTCVRDAAHLFGRLSGFRTREAWTKQDDLYESMVTDMEAYYADAANRETMSSPCPGDMGAVLVNSKYYRISILYKEYVRPADQVREVQVFLIDEGTFEYVEEMTIFKLPEQFARIPRQAYEVFLGNVSPVDKDSDWTSDACWHVKTLTINKELTGKVQLSLGYTLWLNPLVRMTKLSQCSDYVREYELREELISKGYAMENPSHIADLTAFCQTVFNLPDPIELESNSVPVCVSDEQDVKSVTFAFLPVGELVDVFVSHIVNPGKFYLQRCESSECLESLMDEIEDYVKQCSYKGISDFKEGLLCLAPKNGFSIYYRARIVNTSEASGKQASADGSVTVFLVDYGDTVEVKAQDLMSLPNKFIWKLPLQAIEVSLAGLIPLTDRWSDEAKNEMQSVCFTSEGGMQEMTVEAVKKIKQDEQLGSHYSVRLFSLNFDISDQLFANGYAREADEAEEELDSSIEHEVSANDEKEETNDVRCSEGSISSYRTVESDVAENTNQKCIQITPLTKWAQRKDRLFLKFMIVDIKEHRIEINDSVLKYRATTTAASYDVELDLYESVNKEDVHMEACGRYVRVTLKKVALGSWPRLIKSKEKMPHIAIDHDVFVDSSDEENEQLLESWRTTRMAVESSNTNFKGTTSLVSDFKDMVQVADDSDSTSSEDESGYGETDADGYFM